MKKLLVGFLAFVLLLGCIPCVTVAAEDDSVIIKPRYTVLVLDTADEITFSSYGVEIYTAGTAISYVKKAANRFLDCISTDAGDNYVAVVAYQEEASLISGFTMDFGSLKEDINAISSYDNYRSITGGLAMANDLMAELDGMDVIKNVVLFSTGMTSYGEYDFDGHYDESAPGSTWVNSSTNIELYAYANVAYNEASKIKEKDITLYSLGLFQTMEEMPEEGQEIAEFFRLTAKDLATSEDYFYPVEDPEMLEFTFGEVAGAILNPVLPYEFTYSSGGEHTATCYYSNDYFRESSEIYNQSLATMSMSLCMAAFGSSEGGQTDYSNKSKNVEKLLDDLGFKGTVKVNEWYNKKPTTDSIGAVAASKTIIVGGETYTLIALAIRGGGYEQEWASNFTIGTSGLHQGFDTAKKEVYSFLKGYIDEMKISGPVKLWITGYSRAAAVANLLGAYIDEGADLGSDISFGFDDVFTYCFETPAGALAESGCTDPRYDNIHNVLNFNDPVVYVAPVAMGFWRYGQHHWLPSQITDPETYSSEKSRMLEIYNGLSSTGEYIVDDFHMKKLAGLKNWGPGGEPISLKIEDDEDFDVSQAYFLLSYIEIIVNDHLFNRAYYTDVYQDQVRNLCSIIFGCSDGQVKQIIDLFSSKAKEGWPDLVWSYIKNVGLPWGGGEEEAFEVICDWLKFAVEGAGVVDYDKELLNRSGKDFADLLLSLVSTHPNYATTAILNLGCFGAAHYPELCYSWLASMDVNYTEGAKPEYTNGGFRIIRINCDVDVEVLDAEGKVVASIVGEKPVPIDGSEYLYGVDENGQKFVVLPTDMDFEIKIIGREDDKVSYGVKEYSATAGAYTRNINAFEIDLKKGETLTGTVPAYDEEDAESGAPRGSKTVYELFDHESKPIEFDSDLMGEEVAKAVYTLNVTPSDKALGMVIGSGQYLYGTFVRAEAYAAENAEFLGWYIGETLVSEETSYRVNMLDNLDLVARFEPDECLHENTERVGVKEATCLENGYTGDLRCVDCGVGIVFGEPIEGTHSYGDWSVVKEATEEEDGQRARICSVCGDTQTEKIAATGTKEDKSGNGGLIAVVIIVIVMVLCSFVILALVVANNSKSGKNPPYGGNNGAQVGINVGAQAGARFGGQAAVTGRLDRPSPKTAPLNNTSIKVLSGSMAGTVVPVPEGAVVSIGKDPRLASMVLSADYINVSRAHCTVAYQGQQEKFFVTDKSSNGTYYTNGERLTKGRPTPVARGTVLWLANEKCAIVLE